MADGIVKWFNEAKGYGFIEQENGKDLFVHQNEVTGYINEGDDVEFEVSSTEKGLQATNVKM